MAPSPFISAGQAFVNPNHFTGVDQSNVTLKGDL